MKRCAAALAGVVAMTLSAQACRAGERSPGTAFLLSLLLPGAGHLYAGNSGDAKRFFVAEGILWGGFGSFKARQVLKGNDMKLFARTHGGVDISDRSDAFLGRVELYDTSTAYNRRAVHESGPEAVFYTGQDAWQWDSPAARRRFADIREERLSADNASTLVLGVLVLNRLVAGITAVRAARGDPEGHLGLLPRKDGLAVRLRLP